MGFKGKGINDNEDGSRGAFDLFLQLEIKNCPIIVCSCSLENVNTAFALLFTQKLLGS